jgi:hypothetical protein
MGESSNTQNLFQIQSLVSNQMDLSHLVEPFTNEEIDKAIKEMPSERAPGPDGFNMQSLKNAGISLSLTSISCVMIFSMTKLTCRQSTALCTPGL